MPAAKLSMRSLLSLMDDASALNETILQWLSRSPTARQIDREMGDLGTDLLAGEPLLTYLRYDVLFERTWLQDRLGFDLTDAQLDSIHEMDRPENLDLLAEVGKAASDHLIEDLHFPAAFNL